MEITEIRSRLHYLAVALESVLTAENPAIDIQPLNRTLVLGINEMFPDTDETFRINSLICQKIRGTMERKSFTLASTNRTKIVVDEPQIQRVLGETELALEGAKLEGETKFAFLNLMKRRDLQGKAFAISERGGPELLFSVNFPEMKYRMHWENENHVTTVDLGTGQFYDSANLKPADLNAYVESMFKPLEQWAIKFT